MRKSAELQRRLKYSMSREGSAERKARPRLRERMSMLRIEVYNGKPYGCSGRKAAAPALDLGKRDRRGYHARAQRIEEYRAWQEATAWPEE